MPVPSPPENHLLAVSSTGDAAIGRMVGSRYQLVAPVGAGASARVYLAKDLTLGRNVAVKCLRSGFIDDRRFLRRFEAEARAAAQLSHPNLLAVYDWGKDDETAFIITEILLGGSLRAMIDRSPCLSLSQGLLVGLQVAEGLAYAHQLGWVHRDIKPANVLFGEEGRLRIADFGIARAIAEATLTEPEGVLMGTARYAAPEQAEGDLAEGKADVYSLALTIIEAVTGEVPLLRDNALATLLLRRDTDVGKLDRLGPLGQALADAGRADPAKRPTAAELITALTGAARKLPRPRRLPLVNTLEPSDGTPATEPVLDRRSPTTAKLIDLTEPIKYRTIPRPPPLQLLRSLPPSSEVAPSRTSRPGIEQVSRETPAASAPVDPPAEPEKARSEKAKSEKAESEKGRLDTAELATAEPETASCEPPAAVDEAGWGEGEPVRLRHLFDHGPASALSGPGGDAATAESGPARQEPRISTRSLFRLLPVLAGVLVLVPAAVVGLSSLRSHGQGDEAAPAAPTLGDYVGATVSDVEAEADTHAWELVVSGVRRDGTTLGQVLDQQPEAGRPLAGGGSIEVEVSLGPELRTVPALVGRNIAEADGILGEASLDVGAVTSRHDERAPEGDVLAVRVDGAEPGNRLATATPVDLVVSAGPPAEPLPSFVGLTRARAAAQSAELGLALVETEDYSEAHPEGHVMDHVPPTGTPVREGDELTLVVSLGPPLVVVPDVTGLAPAIAAETLAAAGFVVTDTIGPPNLPVIGTEPAVGEVLAKGTAISVRTVAG